MPARKAVIFDLDGCLVDSEPLSLGAIAQEMQAIGIADATPQEIGAQFLGVAMPVIVDYVAKRLGHDAPRDFADRVEARLLQSYETQLRRIDGATALLNALHSNGFALAVATGGSLRRMKATLHSAELDQWFPGTAFSAEEVAKGKPAPDLFELAMSRLGCAPDECLVLEDSPHGVTGAKEAGIAAIGFVGGSHLKDERAAHAGILRAAGAVEVFERLEDVKKFILSASASDMGTSDWQST